MDALPHNRLTAVKLGNTTINTNTYRADGQRISKVEGGVTTYYIYSGGSVLYTTDAQGKRTTTNFYAPGGGIIASRRYSGTQAGKYISYAKDIRTSTSAVLNDAGTYLFSYDYSDFGETTRNGDQAVTNEIAYTGGVYDKSTALYYLNARYYNPLDARFMTQDTYRGENNDPATLHLYAYCAGNPIGFTDPSGHAYNATEAKKYAGKWWNDRNPKFPVREPDCANFVSQCLFAGGIPMTEKTGKYKSGSKKGQKCYSDYDAKNGWYATETGASNNWEIANCLQPYLSNNKKWNTKTITKNGAKRKKLLGVFSRKGHIKYWNQAKRGDLIFWHNGSVVQHSTFVMSSGPWCGTKLACHTDDFKGRRFDNLFDSGKFTKAIRVRPK